MEKYKLPTLSTKCAAVILANGVFPFHEIPLSILEKAKYIVCCDGAIDNLAKTNINPQAIVGDCDSLSDENKAKYAAILHQDSDQETNDLTKSVNFCVKQGIEDIIILGATGYREDHTLANISLLAEYMDIVRVEIISNYGVFTPISSPSQFESYEGQQVSIFSIEQGALTSHQLKYPITNRSFNKWWQGTLNESAANSFILETLAKTIVYRAF